jgi:soluble lytic murein transglycosylase-like protein
MKKMKLIFSVVIVFTVVFSGRCYGDLYMYVDESGSIFFTDAPTHSKYIKIKETPKKEEKKQRPESSDSLSARKLQVNRDILYRKIQHTASKHDIDPDLIWAMIKTESNFNSKAVSPKGAKGLMQLMPATARAYNVSDPFDPYDNIEGGIRYMRYLLMMFDGNLRLSLAAYNAGEHKVLSYKRNVPPFSETESYIERVLTYYNYFKYNRGKFGNNTIIEAVKTPPVIQD